METLAIYLLLALAILYYLFDFVSAQRGIELKSVWLLVALALIIRVAAAILWGNGDPFDIQTWGMLARSVLERQNAYADPALIGTPVRMPWLPFQLYLFALSELIARATNIPFVTTVKLLPMLADVAIAALVYYGARALTRDDKLAWRLGLLYALNPLSILDTAIHGQFDSIPALSALAAWFVFQFNAPRRFNTALAGALLGLGILAKTWPLIFVPLFVIHARTWRERAAILFFAGAVPLAGATLYSVLFNANLWQVLSTAASYQSIAGTWGWTQMAGINWASLEPTEATIFGKLLALGALGLYYTLVARKLGLIEGMLSAVLLLFAVAPGLNVYYVMWLVPFALAANAMRGLRVFIAPAFLWLANFYFNFNPFAPLPHAVEFAALGAGLWLLVIGWVVLNLKNIPLPRVDPYLALATLFSIFAIAPLLSPGYMWGAHDGRHSVYFLFEFDRNIQDGIFYPRWFPDMTYGYGYPLFNIYAPGAYYIGEFLHLIGFDFVASVKIVFGLASVFSGVSMFAFVKRLTQSSPAAFLAGLAYVYMPYHIVDVYVRANLAETVALVFLPLAFWGLYETVLHPNRTAIVAAAMAYGATLFTHNGIALLITPVLGIWVLYWMLPKLRASSSSSLFLSFIKLALPPLGSLFLGIGLASIFAIPAVLEFSYISTQQWLSNYYDYSNHFVYLFQFFAPFWGYGISNPGPADNMSFQFGVMPVLLAIFSIPALARNPNGIRRTLAFFLALTLLVTVLMLSISLPAWEMLRITTFAQFPWRLLTLTTLSLAILASAAVLTDDSASAAHGHAASLPTILLGALILLGSYPYLNAPMPVEAKEGAVSLIGFMKFQRSANEMTGSTSYAQAQPEWSDFADIWLGSRRVRSKIDYTEFTQDQVWVGVIPGGLRANGERVAFTSTGDDYWITFRMQYYPGWRAYLVKEWSTAILKELPVEIVDPYAWMRVRIPRGEHWLMLRFDDTPPRTFGAIVSAASVLIALGLMVWEVRTRRVVAGTPRAQ